nr:toprim domain-containing protein [Prolixibacteraceae bacterium]
VGIQNVSCIYGTNGLTDSHITAMYEHLVPEVVLALDNDEAGRKAALNHRDQLVDEDRRVKIIFPEGKDWNEDLVSGKLSKESILAQIEKVEEQKPEPSGRVFRQTDTGIVLEYNNVRYEIQAEGIRFRINCWYEGKLFVDMVNLYSAKSRQTFINTLTEELCLERASIKNDIQELVKYLLTESKVDKKEGKSDEIELTESEKQAGLELLQDPQIFERIVKDMDVLGYVGEELNKVLVYIVSRSCQLASPFSVIVTSQSASGKSALVETVEDLTPKERLMAVSSFTDQALNYAKNINRKFLTISEMMHKEEIEYQLRDIQSKHKLSRMLTMKDLKTGMMESKQIETEAYISIAMTTTSTEINQENASRCFIIQVDESVEQTARILREQKKKFKLEGLEDTEDRQPAVIQAHHAAARMLRPVSILIPYVDAIHYPARFMRVRRDHIRFLYLIAAVCHIRQYQKDMKNHKGMNYIEADAYDYRVAYQQLTENKILSNVSELPRGARDLYEYMREYAREKAESSRLAVNEVTMTQRNLREYTGFGQMWVKRHIRILVDYEYVLCIRGGSARAKGYYKLLADEPIEKIDTDGITTPKEIEAIICKKFE